MTDYDKKWKVKFAEPKKKNRPKPAEPKPIDLIDAQYENDDFLFESPKTGEELDYGV